MKNEHAESSDASSIRTDAIYVGIDWADAKHDICLLEPGSDKSTTTQIENTPEAIHEWIGQLLITYGGRGRICVAVEKARGALLYTLMRYSGDLTLYPLNSKVTGKLRDALRAGGAKNDAWDSRLLAEMVKNFHHLLPVWKPDEEQTRKLAALCEDRRKAVNQRTKLVQELKSLLKSSFPQFLDLLDGDCQSVLAVALLQKWPALSSMQSSGPAAVRRFLMAKKCRRMDRADQMLGHLASARAVTRDPAVIGPAALRVRVLAAQLQALLPFLARYDKEIADLFDQHPDAPVFRSVPGAGEAMAPRLAAAFGSDRARFANATEFSSYCGIAPITKSSGKTTVHRRRRACSKFLRQSLHEFAAASIPFSHWAKAYYQTQRQKGNGHHHAVRSLAYKWIRVLFACWKNSTPYDEATYISALKNHGVALATPL